MARSLGIHLQSHGFDFALLEGSAKKFTVAKSGGAVFRADDLRSTKRLGKLIAETTKAGKVDQVVITLPSTGVVMRELSMPFNDREKVMQVLKFEVESELYHLDIEDVIADFIELEDGRATPSLLVSVVGKDRIRSSLEVMDAADCDPPVVTLSHGSLLTVLNALPHSGGRDPEEREAYLHVGAESSLLMVLNGDGTLYAVRALAMGWLELTRGLESTETELAPIPESTEEASSAEGGDAVETDAGEEEEGKEEEEEDHELSIGGDHSLPFGISLSMALEMAEDSAKDRFLIRFANEVRRGLAAMGIPRGGSLYLLGAAIPGLEAGLEARLGKDLAPLDLGLGVEEEETPDSIAIGAAMRGLGFEYSPMNFRQEEYRYARGLERVEGPLTLALVGIIVFFAIEFVINLQVIKQRKFDAGRVFYAAQSRVERLNQRVRDDEEYPTDWIIKSDFAGLDIPDDERIIRLAANVRKAKGQLDELMGASALEMPASCLEAWRLLMDFLEEEMADYEGRWMVESFTFSSVDGNTRLPAHVSASFGITIFPDGSGNFIDRFDRIPAQLNRQSWTVQEATLPSTESVGEEGAKFGTVKVKILTSDVDAEVGR